MSICFMPAATLLFVGILTLANKITTEDITEPVVTIHEGRLKGTSGKNFDGENFLQFFGIPYAKPPIGKLRFKPPLPADSWEGIKDAAKVGNSCIGWDELYGRVEGSEDCLFINVYTRTLPNKNTTSKPVMVYIHGGGLTAGSSRPGMYGPEYFMTKDIVLVIFDYRLGVLGFLGFDDPELDVYGNMGLKDQTLALKWVQRNVASFNGDPSKVTLFGHSAGSGAVHAHILSPLSKGLFHQAIVQSGCALNSWFWGTKNNAREIVSKLGKSAESEKVALEVLKELPALEIYNAQEKCNDAIYPAHRRNFSAVIEIPNDTAFFSKSPIEILKEGSYNKVPIMIGYTETEGMLYEAMKMGGNKPEFNMEYVIPYELNVTIGSGDSKKINKMLKALYSNSSDSAHYDEITDGHFLVGIIETIKNQLKTSQQPIFLYRISLAGKLNYLKQLLNRLNEPGVCHADELGYLFHSDITPKINSGSPEERQIKSFIELWTNFAIHGNPTPNNNKLNVIWKPVENEENIKVLDIGEDLVFKNIPELSRLEIWWNILRKWPIARFD